MPDPGPLPSRPSRALWILGTAAVLATLALLINFVVSPARGIAKSSPISSAGMAPALGPGDRFHVRLKRSRPPLRTEIVLSRPPSPPTASAAPPAGRGSAVASLSRFGKIR